MQCAFIRVPLTNDTSKPWSLCPDCEPSQRRALLGGAGAAAGLLAVYRGDVDELHWDAATAAQQALQHVDAERAHNIGLWAAAHGFTPRQRGPDPPALRTAVWGRHFPNPIGVYGRMNYNALQRAWFACTACLHADAAALDSACFDMVKYVRETFLHAVESGGAAC